MGVIFTGGEPGARMADTINVAPSKTTIALGLLTVLAGCVPLLAMSGILPRPTSPTADPAPLWMGWLIGAAFVGAGLNVTMRGILGGASETSGDLPPSAPRALRLANEMIAVGIVGALALSFSWVAFGPGPRHFSVGFNGLWLRGFGGGEMMGRVAFGFGAMLFWLMTAAFTVAMLRKWRR
jgi:hypothetical protein